MSGGGSYFLSKNTFAFIQSHTLNLELFIVKRIAFARSKSFSAFIIRIAVAAVTLSVATMIIATAMVNGFQKEIRKKVLSSWSHLYIRKFSLTNSLQEEPVYRFQDFYTKPSLLPEVRHLQVTAMKGGLLKTDDDFEGIVLKGVAEDFDWSNFVPYLKEGDTINVSDPSSERDILISSATARRLLLKPGDKIVVSFIDRSIRNRPFKVKGIYETGLEEFDRQFALVNLSVIQDLNGWGKDTVGGFEVFLKDDNLFKGRLQSYFLIVFGGFYNSDALAEMRKDPIDIFSDNVYGRLSNPQLDVVTIKSKVPGIFDWLELQSMNEMIILFLMLVVAAINMITALIILILERTTMIGILKALGATTISVRKVFLWYSAFIVGAGLLAGNLFGLGICLLQKHFHLLKLPQESYYLSYAPVEINLGWVLGLNIATILVTLLLLIVPSGLIARISPVKAIRFE